MREKTSMRHIREVLKLVCQQGLSRNQAAQALGIGRSTSKEICRRFQDSGIPLENALALSDADLEKHLYPSGPSKPSSSLIEPDMDHVATEMKRPGVTLKLLWEEYRKAHPDGLGYTQFWKRWDCYGKPQSLVMRQEHTPGEKVFVDYSGDRPEIVNKDTGEVTAKELFVMCWGASTFMYAEAQDSQNLSDWTMGHARSFEYFGCTPLYVVPDCLRSAVTKAHRYDPQINRTYTEMCAHYGVVAMPARPYSPRDKGKVENAVRIAQQRIIAVLRNRVFHSLSELNQAIREEVDRINSTPMQGRDGKCRRDFFLELDRPAARTLPKDTWQYQKWMVRRAGLDYCVEVDKHWYSVPHALAKHSVDVCVTATAVEIYKDRERVAVHPRVHRPYCHSIQRAHMPDSHSNSLPVDLEKILWRAGHIGPSMQELVQARIDGVTHSVEAIRACLGLVRRAENCHDNSKAERAARFALDRRMTSCPQYEKILRSGVVDRPVDDDPGVVRHANLHGLSKLAKEG